MDSSLLKASQDRNYITSSGHSRKSNFHAPKTSSSPLRNTDIVWGDVPFLDLPKMFPTRNHIQAPVITGQTILSTRQLQVLPLRWGITGDMARWISVKWPPAGSKQGLRVSQHRLLDPSANKNWCQEIVVGKFVEVRCQTW